MRYYSITFESYNGFIDKKYATSKDTKTTVDLDKNGKLLVKESEVGEYLEKFNIYNVEYAGTTIE